MENKIILIAGPTASGKSSLANTLAKKIDGEIINADSIQIYKDLEILTARPKPKENDPIHHLYGFVNGDELWSVGKWINEAKKITQKIIKKNSTPILVGGTGLYFKALTDGLANIPNIPFKTREKIRSLYKRIGSKNFHKRLKMLDPLTKNYINPADSQRSIRAYEVKLHTNISIYDWFKKTKSNFKENEFYKIYIDLPREDLLNRISIRAKKMIKNGGIQEVRNFIKLRVKKDKTACKAIGIGEVQEYLNKKIEIEQLIDKISIKTRQYAKRQTTWGRGNMEKWIKLNPKSSAKFLKKF